MEKALIEILDVLRGLDTKLTSVEKTMDDDLAAIKRGQKALSDEVSMVLRALPKSSQLSTSVASPSPMSQHAANPWQHSQSVESRHTANPLQHSQSVESRANTLGVAKTRSVTGNSADSHYDVSITRALNHHGDSHSCSAWSFYGLPPTWPKCIHMKTELKPSANDVKEPMAVVASLARQISSMHESEVIHKGSYFSVLDPDSYAVVAFDALSLVFLAHDLFLTPYVMVMDAEVTPELQGLAAAAALYWSMDFLIGFNVGYYRKGELCTDRKVVLRHYASTWLFPNLLIMMFDLSAIALHWTEKSAAQSNAILQLRVMRILKVLRFMKFFRLVRLLKLIDKFSGYVSRGTRTILQVCKIAFFVLIYNHFLSCLWCWIGRTADSNTGSRWTEYEATIDGEGRTFNDFGDVYVYVSAFHWTVAQMTPGPIDIVATNMVEKVFNTLLLLFGLFFVSIIVSLMSGQVMQLIISQRDMQDKLDKLEKYLRQTKIPRSLAVRVQRQVMDRLGVGGPIKEEDVVALKQLSVNLRHELLSEARKFYLFLHPLFSMWHQIDVNTFKQLCVDAVHVMYLSSEDELFAPEEEGTSAYVINRGKVIYTQTPDTSRVVDMIQQEVKVRTWFCEAALWSDWLHVGRAEARTACQICALEAKALLAVVQKKVAVAYAIKQYGRSFYMRIVNAAPPECHYPTDIHVPNTDIGDLAPQYVGIGLFKSAIKRGRLQLSDMNQAILEEELRSEKSTLQQNAVGDLTRIVAVVALRLKSEDRRILAMVGKWRPGQGFTISCELPGCKRTLGELPHKALQRVIEDDLAPFAKAITLEGSEQDKFTRDSPRFGMRTTYLRTVHDALFKPDCFLLEESQDVPQVAVLDIQGEQVPIISIVQPVEARFYAWLSVESLDWCRDEGSQHIKEQLERIDVAELIDTRAHTPDVPEASGDDIGDTPNNTTRRRGSTGTSNSAYTGQLLRAEGDSSDDFMVFDTAALVRQGMSDSFLSECAPIAEDEQQALVATTPVRGTAGRSRDMLQPASSASTGAGESPRSPGGSNGRRSKSVDFHVRSWDHDLIEQEL